MKLMVVFFAVSLLLSSAVISSPILGDASFSAYAQQITVKKRRKAGIIRNSCRGGRRVDTDNKEKPSGHSSRKRSGNKTPVCGDTRIGVKKYVH